MPRVDSGDAHRRDSLPQGQAGSFARQRPNSAQKCLSAKSLHREPGNNLTISSPCCGVAIRVEGAQRVDWQGCCGVVRLAKLPANDGNRRRSYSEGATVFARRIDTSQPATKCGEATSVPVAAKYAALAAAAVQTPHPHRRTIPTRTVFNLPCPVQSAKRPAWLQRNR